MNNSCIKIIITFSGKNDLRWIFYQDLLLKDYQTSNREQIQFYLHGFIKISQCISNDDEERFENSALPFIIRFT